MSLLDYFVMLTTFFVLWFFITMAIRRGIKIGIEAATKQLNDNIVKATEDITKTYHDGEWETR
jgi:hypothetical protein